MAADNTTTLHYLELLNTIASGERRTGIFLQAWADTTPDPALRVCLSMVANRETSHYHVFKRRIAELEGTPGRISRTRTSINVSAQFIAVCSGPKTQS